MRYENVSACLKMLLLNLVVEIKGGVSWSVVESKSFEISIKGIGSENGNSKRDAEVCPGGLGFGYGVCFVF